MPHQRHLSQPNPSPEEPPALPRNRTTSEVIVPAGPVPSPGHSRLRKRKVDLNALGGSSNVCQYPHCGVQMKKGESLEWHYQGHLQHELLKLSKGVRVKKNPADFPDTSDRRQVRNSAVDRIRFRREARSAGLGGDTATYTDEPVAGPSSGEDENRVRLRCPVCQKVVVESKAAPMPKPRVSQGTTAGTSEAASAGIVISEGSPPTSTDEESTDTEGGPPSSELDPVDQYQQHVSACLLNAPSISMLDEGAAPASEMEDDVDVDGRDSYEEYTWAGQTRVRATSLIEGGLRDAPGFLTIQRGNEDEELDIVNDVQEASFGGAQFVEGDVVPLTEQTEAQERLRKAAVGDRGKKEAKKEDKEEEKEEVNVEDEKKTREELLSEVGQLRQLNLCNICLNSYRNPTVSVSCWHVLCKECWLRSLGAKKLCPQCKTIVTAKDLRRIYL